MTDNTIIEITGLYKVFGKSPQKVMPLVREGVPKDEILNRTGHTLGLKDINLKICRGEIFVIMGLSGSGKSTLIRHFNRLIDPTEGQIKVEDTDIMKLGLADLRQFRRKKMSMVFQHFGLLPHYTVMDNVAFGLKTQGVDKKSRNEKARQWLQTVGLGEYGDQYPSQLSGGQQQRVGLARALCTDADILLMDEAFSALDPLIRSEMQDQLIALQEKLHKTIIFITHDLDEALRLGDRIAILRDGELVQVGEPKDILLEPADDYVEAFVRDVNRARALTVDTVMKPPSCRIAADLISDAIRQMKQSKSDYAFCVNEKGYQGSISRESLEKLLEKQGDGALDASVINAGLVLSPNAIIEEVIPDTLESEFPLPVVNEKGELEGEISRRHIANILSVSHHEPEASNEEANEPPPQTDIPAKGA